MKLQSEPQGETSRTRFTPYTGYMTNQRAWLFFNSADQRRNTRLNSSAWADLYIIRRLKSHRVLKVFQGTKPFLPCQSFGSYISPKLIICDNSLLTQVEQVLSCMLCKLDLLNIKEGGSQLKVNILHTSVSPRGARTMTVKSA